MWVYTGSARLYVEGTEARTSYIFAGPETELYCITWRLALELPRRLNASLTPSRSVWAVAPLLLFDMELPRRFNASLTPSRSVWAVAPLLLFDTETIPVCNYFCDTMKANL